MRVKTILEYRWYRFFSILPGFYEKDKKRLANIMAYGEDIEPPDKTKFVRPPPPPEPYVDRFDECKKFKEIYKKM